MRKSERVPTAATRRGAEPSKHGQHPSTSSEYDRFEHLTKRLLSVPKKEIKEQAKKGKRSGGV